jgi:hypothetical protein
MPESAADLSANSRPPGSGRWPVRLLEERRSLLLLSALFILSRVFYHEFAGLRFDATTLAYFAQIMDPHLLTTDLLRTILYMHSQPPLFNLLIGLALKSCPDEYELALTIAYTAVGFAFMTGLYLLMLSLRVNRVVALILAAIHTISPTTVRYENWLFYAYPVAAGLCVSALSLHRALFTRRTAWAFLYFSSLAALVLTRSTMTWFWFLGCAGGAILAAKGDRARFARSGLLPAILVAAVPIKQLMLFGTPTVGDVYAGGNLAVKLSWALTAGERGRLESERVVSPYFSLLPFDEKIKSMIPPIPPTGVPVLDEEKKTTGSKNHNNVYFRTLSERQFEDAVAVIRRFPGAYLRSVKQGWWESLWPSGDNFFVARAKSDRMNRLSDIWDFAICGQTNPGVNRAWTLALAMPLLLVYGVVRLIRPGRDAPPERITLGYILFNILFVTGVTIAVSSGDFSRYRFDIDSFYVVLLGLALTSVTRWRIPQREPLLRFTRRTFAANARASATRRPRSTASA